MFSDYEKKVAECAALRDYIKIYKVCINKLATALDELPYRQMNRRVVCPVCGEGTKFCNPTTEIVHVECCAKAEAERLVKKGEPV